MKLSLSKKFSKLMLTILISLTLNFCSAQKSGLVNSANSTVPKKEFKQAVNFCPIALALGIYSINYERMINKHHGLMGRVDYESIPHWLYKLDVKANGKAAILNYRYHIKGGLQSFFVGSFARYRVFSGTGNAEGEKFSFTLPEVSIGLNLGKRWIFNNGINITTAGGYGYFMDREKINSNKTSAVNSVRQFQKKYDLYNGFFGEISLGYAFKFKKK